MREQDRSKGGRTVRHSRRLMEKRLSTIRRSDDLDSILAFERAILKHDLRHHANSQAMRTSLDNSIAVLEVATRLLDAVRDPGAYRAIDAGYRMPGNRTGGVPRDEARQFFRSHATRLLNQDKSRLEESEKRVLDQRRLNMRHAEKLYTALQERALGLETDRKMGHEP